MEKIEFQRISANVEGSSFLNRLSDLLDDQIEVYAPIGSKKVSRVRLDGLWLIKGSINHEPVAVIWSDFRVKGGSFGKYACEALQSFLGLKEIANLPLIMGINSLGFRFMEGRTIFNSVFGIIPAIAKHKEKNLVMTISFGQCLGLGALVFGLGHYRIAVEEDTTINLAGPDVFKMFFGENIAFDDVAGSRRQYIKTDMIHEVVDDLPEAKERAKMVFLAFQGKSHHFHYAAKHKISHKTANLAKALKSEKNLLNLLENSCDEYVELFEGYNDRLRAYIVQIDGQFVGLLANPPKNVNNMFTCRAITLYLEAIQLFEHLGLPLVAALDTPGVDPRMDGNNQYTIDKLLQVTEKIINYPYKKLGIITGRGYGGANTLAIPKVYGSEAVYILDEDTEVNVMHESIIRKLLTGSNQLLNQWEESLERQCPEFSDMIEAGNIDRVINKTQIKELIAHHLLELEEQQPCETLTAV